MNRPAATAALIGRAVAALEGRGKVVAGVMATADKAAVVLTVEGLAALVARGVLTLPGATATTGGLTTPPLPESSAVVDLDDELQNWASNHAPH
jgi:hypothetical protein